MKLYIAEKPSLARAIAAVLPGPQKKADGMIQCGGDQVVSWCIGHLLEQAEPDAYGDQYKKWRLDTLPIVPEQWQLKPRASARGQLAILRKLVKQADDIVHAGDPDREGQLLVDEVIDYLNVPKAKRARIQRCLISDLNPAAVRKALNKMRPNTEFIPLSVSALARSRADWLFGMNMTRALTLKGQQMGYQGVLSVGRVQTPILGLVVQRDHDIEAFQSKPYYEVDAHLLTAAQARFKARWQPSEACAPWQDEEGRVLHRPLAENVAQRITGQNATVTQATRKPGQQPPPLPYNLSSLQIDAAKRYGLSAQAVLDAAQTLYERHQLITYPRSDCRYLPREHWPEAGGISQAIQTHEPQLASAVQGADLSLKGRSWNDKQVQAHHAIIPTARAARVTLNRVEQQVYALIARQYLMQFYPPFSYTDTQLTLDIAGGTFVARARETRDLGWKQLISSSTKGERNEQDDAPEADTNASLPPLNPGDTLWCERGEVLDKATQPPKAFTDATLLAAMTGIARFVQDQALRKILRDTDGLGTEATRAGILELLFTRGFLSRQGKLIHATPAGKALIAALPEALARPDMTAHWESHLDAMSRREYGYQAFMTQLSTALPDLIAQLNPAPLQGIPSASKGKGKRGSKKTRRPTKPRQSTGSQNSRSQQATRAQRRRPEAN